MERIRFVDRLRFINAILESCCSFIQPKPSEQNTAHSGSKEKNLFLLFIDDLQSRQFKHDVQYDNFSMVITGRTNFHKVGKICYVISFY